MAFRGRGRGRGWGGGGRPNYAKQEPFIPFPGMNVKLTYETTETSIGGLGEFLSEDVVLPVIKDVNDDEKNLVVWNSRLQIFWKSSPYFIEGDEGPLSTTNQTTEIVRFADKTKPRTKNRADLLQYLELKSYNFPQELLFKVATKNQKQRISKKAMWNPESDLKKLDFLEKLETKFKGEDEEEAKEKKEGEGEDEVDEEKEVDDEEFSDDGDYNKNIDFDDDEDDFNMEDEIDDGPTY